MQKKTENKVLRLFKRYQRVLLYAIVGGINTGVAIGVFNLLFHLTPLRWIPSYVIGYIIGIATSFVLNRNLAFRDGDHPKLASEMLRFLVVNLTSLGVSTLVGHALVLVELHASVAHIFATGLAAVINYFGYKILVFRVRGK